MINKKIRRRKGFTLAETLIAIVLLLLATGIVTVGIPMAIEAYKKVTQAANAQALLSTTMTELRDKIAFSEDVKVDSSNLTVTFTGENGRSYKISNQNTDSIKGIYMEDVTVGATKTDSRLLVSDEAASKELYAKYDSITYSSSNSDLITFNNVKVYRKSDNHELSAIEKYDIELMNNE